MLFFKKKKVEEPTEVIEDCPVKTYDATVRDDSFEHMDKQLVFVVDKITDPAYNPFNEKMYKCIGIEEGFEVEYDMYSDELK